jgi:hypothetical protein
MYGINEASGGTTFNLPFQPRQSPDPTGRENNFQNRLVSRLHVLMKQHLYHQDVHISSPADSAHKITSHYVLGKGQTQTI